MKGAFLSCPCIRLVLLNGDRQGAIIFRVFEHIGIGPFFRLVTVMAPYVGVDYVVETTTFAVLIISTAFILLLWLVILLMNLQSSCPEAH